MALPTGGRFSASGFLPDVRRHGVTYCNYVGRPLSYVLATPEQPDDADNPLRFVFGNEAAPGDVERFARRFGCDVSDNYGSTEGGVAVSRTPDTPDGALGPAPPDVSVVTDDGHECAVARIRRAGSSRQRRCSHWRTGRHEGFSLLRGLLGERRGRPRQDAAMAGTGREISSTRTPTAISGSPAALTDRLRVDGENLAAAPVVRILERHPDVVMAAVYAIPDPVVGDQVMAALQLMPGVPFDAAVFGQFLASQTDLGPKWVPRYLRVSQALPTTATAKILVRQLRAEGLDCEEPVWELVAKDLPCYVNRDDIMSTR